jgi:hypothetical protein
VLEQFGTTGASLISTNLSNEQEARLREAFAEQEGAEHAHVRGGLPQAGRRGGEEKRR